MEIFIRVHICAWKRTVKYKGIIMPVLAVVTILRPKSRWSNNSGLNIFTTANTEMMIPSYFTVLFHAHIGTLTNMALPI